MAQFEADIRLYDVAETDAVAARKAVDERLRAAGFRRWKIVKIGHQGAVQRPLGRTMPRGALYNNPSARARADAGQGAWVVVAALAWAIWFVWLLGG